MNKIVIIALCFFNVQLSAHPQASVDCEAAISKGTSFLLQRQQSNGGFSLNQSPTLYDVWANAETNRSWHVATAGIAAMALMAQPSTEVLDASLLRTVDYLCTSAPVKRPDDWDTDNTWAYVYSLCALTRAASHQAVIRTNRGSMVAQRAQSIMQQLYKYQSPMGGWAYYADETKAVRPNWATSFQTAVAVIGLLEAKQLGWNVDEHRLQVAIDTLIHCRLPDGSYTYSVEIIPRLDAGVGIDNVKGGLSRIQSCNYALYKAAQMGYTSPIGIDELQTGLDQLFSNHHYLDIARGRPFPHEAYHYNSGYFYFFGHYYAGQILELLPLASAEKYFASYVNSVVKTQHGDGSMLDFFMGAMGKEYGAAFGVAGLCHARNSIKK
ncbi:MAG: hypothetical protein H8E25_02415 [Planctomycetes bacterium]|nr:hypothetical protein [Planctomycetota bacterium]